MRGAPRCAAGVTLSNHTHACCTLQAVLPQQGRRERQRCAVQPGSAANRARAGPRALAMTAARSSTMHASWPSSTSANWSYWNTCAQAAGCSSQAVLPHDGTCVAGYTWSDARPS